MLRNIIIAITLSVITIPSSACEIDSDCGAGGTCIKREKRAGGVCYGGDLSQPGGAAPPPAAFFDPLSTSTERPKDACFVTEECPAGMDCVKAGMWGSCLAL
jgi:hypothetical protein